MEGVYKNIHPAWRENIHPPFLISAFSDSGNCATCSVFFDLRCESVTYIYIYIYIYIIKYGST